MLKRKLGCIGFACMMLMGNISYADGCAGKQLSTKDELNTCLANNKRVVVFFKASWCAPCKQLQPVLISKAPIYPMIAFVTIDVDNSPEIADESNISGLPALKYYKDNLLSYSVEGYNSDLITYYLNKLALPE